MVHREYHNLALAGFMGAGKSSVGRALAIELDFDFLDTDDIIESQTGKAISRIFAEQGEPAFRRLEREVVRLLRDSRRAVVATGGGLVCDLDNLNSLKQHALVVCLWASPRTIWERVRHQARRPLLQTADPKARIRELLQQRESSYRQADVLVSTDFRPLRAVVQLILSQFHMARTTPPGP